MGEIVDGISFEEGVSIVGFLLIQILFFPKKPSGYIEKTG